ncbi:MAG: glycoside hydrolase family 71/99-like protein [Pirellulales bacterium]
MSFLLPLRFEFNVVLCLGAVYFLCVHRAHGQSALDDANDRPEVLVHVMPWFVGKMPDDEWGWHWTMGKTDPNQRDSSGAPSIAAHRHPLIGPYDSGDPHVIEYQLLTMKIAGVSGVIFDWYGLQDFRDYAILHRNTERMIEQLNRYRLKFAICYEDQTVPALVSAGKIQEANRVAHVTAELNWIAEHWFSQSNYARIAGRPILLSFGYSGLSTAEWQDALSRLKAPPHYFSEHAPRFSGAGAYDWPIPQQGADAVSRFNAVKNPQLPRIPVVYPGFHDYYAEAGLHSSYGRIDDERGKLFSRLLAEALSQKCSYVQIATWNDWGEGTEIEPSRETGTRDLQELRRQIKRTGQADSTQSAVDLDLPHRILKLRRDKSDPPAIGASIDQAAMAIIAGRLEEARRLLDACER